ncbi:helix-turn-helix transcriptional regulator [Catenulispora subtropica]|uniref:HTH cro/C1-type domain-containing protein n=1 Tax=Catenulispora subtropica TaxID=450798 RepID=A0ABN2S4U6_9ACTN
MAKSRQTGPRRVGLARAREAAGLTQEAFAALAGVEVSTVVRWESGTTTPLPGKRPRIARALGIGLHDVERLLSPGGSRPGGTAGAAGPGEPDDARLAAITGVREEIAGLVGEYEARPTTGLVVRAAGLLARVEALRSAEAADRAGRGRQAAGGAGLVEGSLRIGGGAVSQMTDQTGRPVSGKLVPTDRAQVFRGVADGSGSSLSAAHAFRGVAEGPAVSPTSPSAVADRSGFASAAPVTAVAPSVPATPWRWRRDLDITEAETALLVGRLLWDAAGRRDPSAAEELFDRAARRAAQAGDSVLQASAILRSAFLGLYGGDPRAGIRRCVQASVVAAPVSHALFALARLHAAEGYAMLGHVGEVDRALAAARAAMALIDADDPAPDACPPRTYRRLSGAAHLALGRYAEARAALTAAAAGHEPGKVLAVVLGHLALACLGEGDADAALPHLRTAIELAEATRSPGALAVAFRAARELVGVSGGAQPGALETVDRLLALSATG